MKIMKRNQFSLFLLFLVFIIGCKTANEEKFESLNTPFLESAFEKFKEPAITHRRFKHADLQPLIQKHQNSFQITELGKSVEGRSITSLDWGKGSTKVMLWSQ
ncbi:MAG TPA: peptidase M14, partial [Algoriphagus sp.]|nr:peptidase M14 [Algoriphagus sp.]